MIGFHESTLKKEVLCVLWGAVVACALSAIIEVFLIQITHISFQIVINYWAPVVEEILKALFVIILLSKIRYRSITTGIVYGSLIGIGFAYVENIVFLFAGTALQYRLLTGLLHIIETGLFGGMLAYGLLFQPTKSKYWAILGIIIAIILHMSVNATAYPIIRLRLFITDILWQSSGYVGIMTILVLKEQQILRTNLKQEFEKNVISRKEYLTFLGQINKFPYFRYYNQIFLCGARLAIMAHYQKIHKRSFYSREVLVKRIHLFRMLHQGSR